MSIPNVTVRLICLAFQHKGSEVADENGRQCSVRASLNAFSKRWTPHCGGGTLAFVGHPSCLTFPFMESTVRPRTTFVLKGIFEFISEI